ncbi:MAG TPA: type II secretion system F family protein [Streptosporangiaceae bacterium]|nr:type II secretion system F family protein [Streptosporangiaceae bacterium]
MTGTMLLGTAVGALTLAIALLVISVAPARPLRGAARALAVIEQGYSQVASGRARAHRSSASSPGWLRAIARRLSPAGTAAALQHRLDIAGNPGSWTADRVLAAKGLGLLALGVLGTVYGLAITHSIGLTFIGLVVGGVVGFYLPDLLLLNAGQRRQQKIQRALPDSLDMLTVCMEAGLGFDAALAQVAQNTDGPLAAEFTRALQEMQIGQARTDALRSLLTRTTVPELRVFVAALVQAADLGIPIAKVLREQAGEMRIKRRQRAEEQAQKVPVKIMFPLVVCLFPALMVVIIGPGILRIAHALFHVNIGLP